MYYKWSTWDVNVQISSCAHIGLRISLATMLQVFALMFTLTMEVPIVVRGISKVRPIEASTIVLALVPSLLTHPFLWWATWGASSPMTFCCEILVVVVETFILQFLFRTSPLRSFSVSLAANSASYLAGLLLWRFLY